MAGNWLQVQEGCSNAQLDYIEAPTITPIQPPLSFQIGHPVFFWGGLDKVETGLEALEVFLRRALIR